MNEVRCIQQDGQMTILLTGRIDSGNAAQMEAEIMSQIEGGDKSGLTLDAEKLEYISSAGLRVLLRLRKTCSELRIINTSSEIYEILEMTGFTELMTVEKAYRVISIEGCEVIGQGANGTVYRIDGDNVVKVYNNPDSLEDIQNERELARLALVLGVPTAISYDVVRVGDGYGSVFELLDARSFSKILATQPEKMEWCVQEYVDLLRIIHGIEVPEGKLSDMRETVMGWARFMQDYLPAEAGQKLLKLVRDVPVTNHMIHGDYHTKNLELTGDEVLIIDMDTLAVGHPVFELGSMFNAFVGFSECDRENVKRFMGIDADRAGEFWRRSLALYLGTNNEKRINAVEEKARIVGYTRLIRRSIRRGGLEDPQRKAEIDHWKKELIELLEKTETLTFTSSEIDLEATVDNLPKVMDFVGKHLDDTNCSMRERMQLDVAVEEIFINIASYAYRPETGKATVRVEVVEDPVEITITFIDQGVPYDPLAKDDPDVTLSAEERKIGGLGIFLAKQSVDDIHYEYWKGRNILTLKKALS